MNLFKTRKQIFSLRRLSALGLTSVTLGAINILTNNSNKIVKADDLPKTTQPININTFQNNKEKMLMGIFLVIGLLISFVGLYCLISKKMNPIEAVLNIWKRY